MKKLFISVFFLFCLCCMQISTIKVSKDNRSADTLKMLQGEWDFRHIMIPGKKNSAESYYATTLHIAQKEFTQGLSEAYAGGIILTDQHFKFKFTNGDCGSTKSADWCRDMEIYKLTKRELLLLKRNQTARFYFNNQKGTCDVLFCYRKINK